MNMQDPRPRFMWALIAAMFVAVILLSGCSTLPRSEYAWQAVHAVDVAQTLSIAKDPCYVESHPITSGIIGSDPSTGEVIAWGVGLSIAHAGVSHLLERAEAPRWVRAAWQVTTLTASADAVLSNHREGIRPFGSNKPFPGCEL